jgi:uncharacterized protein involved in cysteine biosynthesis
MVIIFTFTFFSRWLELKPAHYPPEKHKWIEYLSYIPAIYLVVVIFHIAEYLFGSEPSLYNTLFYTDLQAMTTIILLVGIGQCAYYLIFTNTAGDKKVSS